VFWTVLWQSFLKVSKGPLQDEKDPYWYTFFIGYDDGDPILSRHDQQLAIIKHFDEQLEAANIRKFISLCYYRITSSLRFMLGWMNRFDVIATHKVGIRFYSMDDTVHAPSWGVSHLAQVGDS
jgi:hypothetical protein